MQPFDINRVPIDGPLLVEASAGTGKTYAITALVLRLLLEAGTDIERILVVTFTEAATAELRERVRGRLVEARDRLAGGSGSGPDDDLTALLARQPDAAQAGRLIRRALRNLDEAAIFTIHGFCHRMLRDFAVDSGVVLDAELLSDTSALLDEVVHDFWSLELARADAQHVDIYRRQVKGPAACRELVALATRSPEMPLVGAEPAGAPPDLGPFRAAFAAAAMAWRRPIIEGKLAAAEGVLNRNQYRPAHRADWCAEMDRFIRSRPTFPHIFDKLDKFCADRLLAGCKKGLEAQVPRHPFFDACQRLRDAVDAYEAAAGPLAVDFRRRLACYAREQLPARMRARGVLSFDDLLLRLDEALKGPRGERLARLIRQRFEVALIDEFQDTDPTQYAIFRRVWPGAGLFLIGDPKQAIYGFRGADVFAYLAAAAGIPRPRAFTMTTNWRSDAPLVHAVNHLLSQPAAPFVLPRIAFHPVKARPGAAPKLSGLPADQPGLLHLRMVGAAGRSASDEALARLCARDLAALLSPLDGDPIRIDGEPLAAKHIAVLTRSNRQAFAVQAALTDVGVRSVVLGDQSVLEPDLPDALTLQRILAAVLEPTRSGLLRAALSTRVLGVSAAELADMDDEDSARGSRAWQQWVERFRRYHQRWSERGFIQMFRMLMVDNEVYERLLSQLDGERRLTNLLHLAELLHRASVEEHLGPVGLFQWLRMARSTARSNKARPEAMQVRLESDDDAVKLTTIHKSKGLQYPVVFCPFVCGAAVYEPQGDVQFHDPDNGHLLTLLLAGADSREVRPQIEREEMAEGVRLLYVALTRAQHRCSVYWGRHGHHGSWRRSAMAYLLHGADAFAAGGIDGMKAALTRLKDDDMWSRLAALAAGAEGAIGLSRVEVAQGEAAPLEAEPVSPSGRLRSRQIPRPIERWARTASFTELSSRSLAPVAALDPHDWDARQPAAESAPALAPRAASPPATLAAFPRGARAGTCLHALLEHWDFATRDEEAAAARAREVLTGFGFDADRWAEEVGRAMIATCHTPLDRRRPPLQLSRVPGDQRLDELEFLFPVARRGAVDAPPRGTQLQLFGGAGGPAAASRGRLDAAALAAVFADHPSPALPVDYPQRVRRLLFLPLEGFLKGFIDLVFCHRERWYLVDYKSNHLGDALSDYEGEALAGAMASGHYVLQYHLYTVALHRFLARRLPGYRYQRHFGGVYYLFLRGMAPATGPRSGVFFERPPEARIEQLSALLDHPAAQPPEGS